MSAEKLYKACYNCQNWDACSSIENIPLRRAVCTGKCPPLDDDGQEKVCIQNFTSDKYPTHRKKKSTKSKTKRNCRCKK